jgi:hypothetical protein
MNRPFKCTGCGEKFQSWQNWCDHRAVIRAFEMARHEEHTRRCLSPREGAFLVLAEGMGMQEDGTSNRQELVQA